MKELKEVSAKELIPGKRYRIDYETEATAVFKGIVDRNLVFAEVDGEHDYNTDVDGTIPFYYAGGNLPVFYKQEES